MGNPLAVPTDHPNEAVTNFVTRMDTVQKEIHEALERAQRVMKETYDRRHRPITFAVDELVWLEMKNIPTTRPAKKLDHPRAGPFKIIAKHGNSSYELALPKTWKIHPIFNELLLSKYTPSTTPTILKRNPPIIVNNEEEYEIKKILDSQS